MPTAKVRTGQLIDLSYARQLVKNFRDNNLAAGKIKTDDTQAVWFSKDMLLSLLGGSAGAGSDDISGVRIYIGAYEQQPGYPENTADQDKLTVVLVATGNESIEIQRGSVTETAYLDIIEGDSATQPAYPKNAATAKSYMNEGQMCPPPVSVSDLGLLGW